MENGSKKERRDYITEYFLYTERSNYESRNIKPDGCGEEAERDGKKQEEKGSNIRNGVDS